MRRNEDQSSVPLAWVGAVAGETAYVNVGDALSPFATIMTSGRQVVRRPFRSTALRVAAIGTIGQSLEGGVVDVWGSGCSPFANPLDPARRRPYAPPANTDLRLSATRGPMSARLLSGGDAPAIPYGDPAALLPRFYAPKVEKTCELGVILHLAELADRSFLARPKPRLTRYRVPAGLNGEVRLMTMVAPDTVDGVRGKIDEILACQRVVSTSLHGFLLAACYGVPCLYLGSDAGDSGLARAPLEGSESQRVNARFVDLLGGYGEDEITYYRQPHREETDWDALIAAIDAHAVPLVLPDADALMERCPAGCAPLAAPVGCDIWDHPLVAAAPVGARSMRVSAPRGGGLLRRFIGMAS